jgi:hypothetical protein
VPDPRIMALNERHDLGNKHCVEVGCFEGVHTTGLCSFGGRVSAVDSRMENVVKTIVRCAMFGYSPAVFVCDLEEEAGCRRLPQADVLHHVGVLYHLTDPVGHLHSVVPVVKEGIMLDTHYAEEHELHATYRVGSKEYRYKYYREGGKAEVFSGMRDHAKWLRLADIIAVLEELGFGDVDVASRQPSRNGPRALIYARRTSSQ